MSSRGGTFLKRKRLGSDAKELTPDERTLFELIRGKGDMGIWKVYIRKEANIPSQKTVDVGIKSLLGKGLIKEVPDVRSKGKKALMAAEFEPSSELTGGVWYEDGNFDGFMVEELSKACKGVIAKHKVATADGIFQAIKNVGGVVTDLKIEQLKQILDAMCLENTIYKVRSNGIGEFISFPFNTDCYKIRPKKNKIGAFASIPCGRCPRINQCSPDGIICPAKCEYFTKWLDF